jgi:hypothetical protein
VSKSEQKSESKIIRNKESEKTDNRFAEVEEETEKKKKKENHHL